MPKIVELDSKRKKEPKNPDKAKLTPRVVTAAEFDHDATTAGGDLKKWQVIWDTEIQGYGLRLRWSKREERTTKTYILIYRNEQGKRRQLTIGKSTKLAPKQARDVARQKHAEIVLGEDPSKAKQEARQADDEATSFAALARQWVDEYAKAKRKSWETDERRLFPDPDSDRAAYKAKAMKRLHALDFAEVRREGVEDALLATHAAIAAEAPVEADRVVQTVNAVVNWHVKRRNVSGAFKDVMEFVDLNGWDRADDYIRPKELPKLAAALAEDSKKWRCAIWLTLLTGARLKSETLQLRWDDVHFGVGEFTFRETKNGTDHTLPMTPATRAILKALPVDKNTPEYVFPSRVHGQPLKDSRKPFGRLRKRGKFADRITPHALRHTASTYMRDNLHLPDGVNRAVLNHSSKGITDNYAHVSVDGLRDALEKLETFIVEKAKIDDFAKYLKGAK